MSQKLFVTFWWFTVEAVIMPSIGPADLLAENVSSLSSAVYSPVNELYRVEVDSV